MKKVIHYIILVIYGYKYKLYTIPDIIMSIIYRVIPNRKYPVYSAKRMQKYFDTKKRVYDFNGIYIPELPFEYLYGLGTVYIDNFHIHCRFGNNYGVIDLNEYDLLAEGPYCYPYDGNNVMIEQGDIVVDAGAWIGDFAAFAIKAGAQKVYAFEINNDNLKYLNKTAELNPGIAAINAGIGDKNSEVSVNGRNMSAFIEKSSDDNQGNIKMFSLDSFAESEGITKIDFIKADIEGFERNMLMGAQNILRKFAPKLAICTYHRPDDAEVLTRLIKEANPEYTIVCRKHKLCAWVSDRNNYLARQ